MAKDLYANQGKSAPEKVGTDQYIGKCNDCGSRFSWPKTNGTKSVVGTSVDMACPNCGNTVIQSNRNGSAGVTHLHDHQVLNLQEGNAKRFRSLFHDRRGE